jgi:hypothetical protein
MTSPFPHRSLFTPLPTGILRHLAPTDSAYVWAVEVGKIKLSPTVTPYAAARGGAGVPRDPGTQLAAAREKKPGKPRGRTPG